MTQKIVILSIYSFFFYLENFFKVKTVKTFIMLQHISISNKCYRLNFLFVKEA